jgi:hypothetical protein
VHKKHRKLYDARQDAVKNLDKQIQKRRKDLMKTVEMPRSVGKMK